MQLRPFVRALSPARCAVFFGLLALAPAPARAEAPLAIEEAVRLTLANNELAQKAPLRIEVAEGQLERARAAFLPSLDVGGTIMLRPVSPVFSPGASLSLTMPLITPSAF